MGARVHFSVLSASFGFFAACESPVRDLGGIEGTGPVRSVTAELLVGHWMQTIIADSFTGEGWWTFSAPGKIEVLERRHDVRRESPEVVLEQRFDATAALADDVLTVSVRTDGATNTNAFVGAVIEPTSFAPAFSAMDWIPGWTELEPNGLVLLDTALVRDEGGLYRGRRTAEWVPDTGEGVRRHNELELELESSLDEVMAGAACRAALTIRVATARESAAHLFELDCAVEARPEEAWRLLRIHQDEWWQNVTDQLAGDEVSPELRSMMGHAISSQLYFHPDHPDVLVAKSYEMRHGMNSRPDAE